MLSQHALSTPRLKPFIVKWAPIPLPSRTAIAIYSYNGAFLIGELSLLHSRRLKEAISRRGSNDSYYQISCRYDGSSDATCKVVAFSTDSEVHARPLAINLVLAVCCPVIIQNGSAARIRPLAQQQCNSPWPNECPITFKHHRVR